MVEAAMDSRAKKAAVKSLVLDKCSRKRNSTQRNSQRGLFDYLSILFPPPDYLLAAARALLEVPLALWATVALPPGLNSAQRLSYSRLYRCVTFEKQSRRRRRRFEQSAGCRRQISMSLLMNESDEESARRRRICGNFSKLSTPVSSAGLGTQAATFFR
jgi:hypothetical protein